MAAPKGKLSGDHRCGATHVPIPNTLVKPAIADGSAPTLGCESRLSPVLWPAFPKGEAGLFILIWQLPELFDRSKIIDTNL